MNIDLFKWALDYEFYHRRKVLLNIDKKRCNEHEMWDILSPEEKAQIDKKQEYSYMMYKNMYGKFSRFFVPDAVYQTELLPQLNPHDFVMGIIPITTADFADKNYMELLVDNIPFPKTIIREINGFLYDADFNIISGEEAQKILSKYEKLVIKDSNGVGHGKGVDCLSGSEIARAILNRERHNFVVQEILKQSKELSRFNDSSVNIVRMTTLLWHDRVYVLGGVFRVGAPGSFCDHLACDGNSPLVIPLNEDGSFVEKACDCDNFYTYSDYYGKEINGGIPHYQRMKELAKAAHRKFAFHKLIGWDFTINENEEIVCMEYNTFLPGIVQSQCALGPIFNIFDENGESFLQEMLGWNK